ncbi:N-acetylmuramoyl-L-alanine amidase [Flagellimonas eckloniae]|uniref:N-acetylmuramoyl-L-alanine amidase n=1 Tax=Flagellimonas eckloniae TaxID=346185 RepID=UPI001C9E191A|nr:N-acetylmuramoyl-L-alanine amidase [Allomuricauda eckloniae]
MNPQEYHFKLPKKQFDKTVKIPEVWYPGVKDYWEDCTSKRLFNPIFGIKGVIIHATAGHSSSGAVSVMRDGKASFHWLIPDEDEPEHGQIIWATAPETLAAWHVRNSVMHPEVNNGTNKTNHWSLGIELVNSQVNDPFSEWQVKMVADIVKYCWAKYPNIEDVVSHAKLDPSRRSDPGINFPWNQFKEMVLDEDMDDLVVFNEITENKINNVKLAPSLSISGELCC